MKNLILLSTILAVSGCARFHSTQEHTLTDGSKETTRVAIWTFWDAHNEVAKLRTVASDKQQGISLGSISENTSGTNAIEALRQIGTLLQSLPK